MRVSTLRVDGPRHSDRTRFIDRGVFNVAEALVIGDRSP
jgi:hypothetical protein